MNEAKLKVREIFESISGEAGGFPQGTWTTFIRLQGCNLRCQYCDTASSQEDAASIEGMSIDEILDHVHHKHVLITGGEPLLQQNVEKLLSRLLLHDYVVQVETNGSLPLPNKDFDGRPGQLHWVVDRKGPSSGMLSYMTPLYIFSRWLDGAMKKGAGVSVKWVVGSSQDLEHAMQEIEELRHAAPFAAFLISPKNGDGTLLAKMVEHIEATSAALLDRITFSIQLHKLVKMP